MAATARWWLRRANCILLLAADVRLAGVVLGDESGREIHVGIRVDQARIGRHLETAHRNEAHRLGAAGDDGGGGAAQDALGAVRDSLQARRTEAVDGDSRRGHWHTGAQAGDAGHVQALFTLGHRAAEDHVLDLGRVEAGRATKRLANHLGREIVGSGGPERAPGRLAHGRAHGGNDDGVLHRQLPRRERHRQVAVSWLPTLLSTNPATMSAQASG